MVHNKGQVLAPDIFLALVLEIYLILAKYQTLSLEIVPPYGMFFVFTVLMVEIMGGQLMHANLTCSPLFAFTVVKTYIII